MFSIVSRIRACKVAVSDTFASAIGSLILRHCFHLVEEDRHDMKRNTIPNAIGHARDPVFYVGATLILLAFTANET